jgi:hypothetical protein
MSAGEDRLVKKLPIGIYQAGGHREIATQRTGIVESPAGSAKVGEFLSFTVSRYENDGIVDRCEKILENRDKAGETNAGEVCLKAPKVSGSADHPDLR